MTGHGPAGWKLPSPHMLMPPPVTPRPVNAAVTIIVPPSTIDGHRLGEFVTADDIAIEGRW